MNTVSTLDVRQRSRARLVISIDNVLRKCARISKSYSRTSASRSPDYQRSVLPNSNKFLMVSIATEPEQCRQSRGISSIEVDATPNIIAATCLSCDLTVAHPLLANAAMPAAPKTSIDPRDLPALDSATFRRIVAA